MVCGCEVLWVLLESEGAHKKKSEKHCSAKWKFKLVIFFRWRVLAVCRNFLHQMLAILLWAMAQKWVLVHMEATPHCPLYLHTIKTANSPKEILREELEEFLSVSLLNIPSKDVTIGKIILCCGLTWSLLR
jgi:hypothetical protein